MKINDRFEIRVVVVELLDNKGTFASIGDIYNNPESVSLASN